MTYEQTVNWMFNQLPMYQKVGGPAFNAKLDNIISFSSHLGDPHKRFRCIHVAGTNGKGSTSHMLASVLQEAGYKVGLYTSPHLKDYRERIRINGKEISEDFVVRFVQDNMPYFNTHKMSFFEMSVGMAFDYFATEKIDIAVVEVGLGGRLDSTNIITPEVSVITNIGFDHVEFLGDTLEKIAAEKAGIIKEGIPVVISEYNETTFPVFQQIAGAKNAPLILAEKLSSDYSTDLPGIYQKKNIKAVVASLAELRTRGFEIPEHAVINGLSKVVANTGLKGRWYQLSDKPKVICDTGHNKEGLTLVVEQLRAEKFSKLHMVLGFVKEKDLSGVLPLFPKEAIYYFCRPDLARGLEAEILREKAAEHGLEGKIYPSVAEAYKAALKSAAASDLVFVGGSTFVVAEVL